MIIAKSGIEVSICENETTGFCGFFCSKFAILFKSQNLPIHPYQASISVFSFICPIRFHDWLIFFYQKRLGLHIFGFPVFTVKMIHTTELIRNILSKLFFIWISPNMMKRPIKHCNDSVDQRRVCSWMRFSNITPVVCENFMVQNCFEPTKSASSDSLQACLSWAR